MDTQDLEKIEVLNHLVGLIVEKGDKEIVSITERVLQGFVREIFLGKKSISANFSIK